MRCGAPGGRVTMTPHGDLMVMTLYGDNRGFNDSRGWKARRRVVSFYCTSQNFLIPS